MAALRILVVDDHEEVARLSAELLRGWGHEVCTAGSGPEALQQARRLSPQLILLDIDLPDMDGYDIAREIRARPELNGVRLVSMTGYGHDVGIAYWREAGFDDLLVKPVEPDDLRKVLVLSSAAGG